MQPIFEEQNATNRFYHARTRARLNNVLRKLRRQPFVLLPFEAVYPRLTIRGQRERGYHTVPLAQIVGSEGRSRDFDRDWLPYSDKMFERWQSIDLAQAQGRELPPVELYKLGDVYFVRDGHHRISVAQQRGQLEIEAHVIELVIDIPLTARLSITDLARIEEQNDFFTWTELARLRPQSVVAVSHLGGYLDLIARINQHRAQLHATYQREISRDEAITHWYDTNYLPLVELIRKSGLLAAFPNRAEADLYVSVSHHQQVLREQWGRDVALDEALHNYANCYAVRAIHRWFKPRTAYFRWIHGFPTGRALVRRLIPRRKRS